MNRSKIEWTDYSANPIKGRCKFGCTYCYATRMYDRFKWNPEVRLDLSVFDDIDKIKKPSKIFLGSTHEIFGDWIKNSWISIVLAQIRLRPQHTFILLTKNPKRSLDFKIPENVWFGTSIDNFVGARLIQLRASDSKVKFVSFEPLLGKISTDLSGIDWVIIGAQTGPYVPPKKEWVESIMKEARRHDIPIFLKDNLKWSESIQEYPK